MINIFAQNYIMRYDADPWI